MFRQGTILHGSDPTRGNLWIVTLDHSLYGSLLWNGIGKHWMPDASKQDTMSINMVTCKDPWTYTGQQDLPQWAKDLVIGASPIARTVSAPLILPKPSVTIPGPVMSSIMKTLQLDTGDNKVDNQGVKSHTEDECKDGRVYHDWTPYTGFTHCFEFCKYCDKKRAITESSYWIS